MTNGDISNQSAPTILFHQSFIFDETRYFWTRDLKLKKPLPGPFLHFSRLDWVNIGILVESILRQKAEKELERIPFRIIFEYNDLNDIRILADEPWHSILAYYDDNSQRGVLFGVRWQRNNE